MSYDIKLDMDDLKALASDLRIVIEEFENANDNADDTADATGERELAGKVRGFASKWKIRRGKMIETIETLQQTIQTITETFEEADQDMARALEEAAEDPGSLPEPVGASGGGGGV